VETLTRPVCWRTESWAGKGEKKRKSAKKQAYNTINGVMLDPCHGLADLYFKCNGFEGIEQGIGATREDCRGGEARLDYLFAPCQWLQKASSWCDVSQEFASDHTLVQAIIEVPADEDDDDTPLPTARDTTRVMLNVAKPRIGSCKKWRTEVLEACEAMEVKLQEQLGWDSVSNAQQEVKSGLVGHLDKAQRYFANVVVDLAEDLWGKTPGKRRKPKSYHDQR